MQRAIKRQNIQITEQDVDRLSALPDALICHILSFMPTVHSVKTSILAKRWRLMWAHVPILDLQDMALDGSQMMSFAGIICTLMLRHKVGSLTTFRLNYTVEDAHDVDEDVLTGCYELETCIATAIERNVQNLDLRLPIKLPRCVLACKTLVDLRIGGGVCIPSGGPIYFKKLYFHPHAYYVDFPHLVSGCPVLEELIINESQFLSLWGTLSSTTLKSLIIDFSDYIGFSVMINAPALRHLKVHGYMINCIPVSLMNSLIEADIDFKDSDHCVLKLLDRICNVKSLILSGYYHNSNLQIMPGSIKFASLTKLELTSNWCFLTMFLESADHLQELIIHEEHGSSKDWLDPIEEGCACLLHSLRTVRIYDFRCSEQGFNMVRFVLRNAQVLERMEIYCPYDLKKNFKKKFDALQRISSFRRGSKECELVFS